MKITPKQKVFVVVSAILIAAFALNYYYRPAKPSDTVSQTIDVTAVIEDLQTLKMVKSDLTPEQQDKYFKRFQEQRDSLNAAYEKVKTGEGENLELFLYWPIMYLGSINRDVGDLKKAEAAFLVTQELDPGAFVPLGNLGDLYFRYMGDYAKAEGYFLKAVEIESSYLETYYGELYEIYRYHMKDDGRAEGILKSGIERWPQETNLIAMLGKFYSDTGRNEEAIVQYRELLRLKPDSVTAQKALEELGP